MLTYMGERHELNHRRERPGRETIYYSSGQRNEMAANEERECNPREMRHLAVAFGNSQYIILLSNLHEPTYL